MTCHEVGELLQHFLDDELDAGRGQRIAEHLEDCRRCGLEAETYTRIKRTIAERHHDDLPAESIRRLREFGEHLARGEEPPGR